MLYKFPKDFIWGTAAASYQIEGAANKDGRGPSIWDAFCSIPTKIKHGHTGEISTNHYDLYKQDIKLMKCMGIQYYRLSISWSRLLPTGHSSVINQEGIKFYNNLIDELIKNHIQPIVTLYHWDLPLALELEYSGWLNSKVIDKFIEYANLCFNLFGNRVKYWITFNEPWCICCLGYVNGEHAPGRTHSPGKEVYQVGHHILLAHGKTVELYRTKYQSQQNGHIAITLNLDWKEPKPSDNSEEYEVNKQAAERGLLFYSGWFADVIYFGDYPDIMKERLGERLPKFTNEEKQLLKGSNDFFGLNHYSTHYVEPVAGYPENQNSELPIYWNDVGIQQSNNPKWKKTDSGWNVVPKGFRKTIEWINQRYHPKGGIWITENGCAWENPDDPINDTKRVNYIKNYLIEVNNAINTKQINVRAYFLWSFLDNLEWSHGYTQRFGCHYVNYETLERTPKLSSQVYSEIIKNNAIEINENEIKEDDNPEL